MIKTAEYVKRGHPDRVCDIIADSILDEYLKQDPYSRVAVEVFGSHGLITIGGEVTSNGKVDIEAVAKDVYRNIIGYESDINIQININKQSKEISYLADLGAGDSGIMIGYATNETKELLPLETVLAKTIANSLDKNDNFAPDGKVQVTIDDSKIVKIVIAYQLWENSSITKQDVMDLVSDIGIVRDHLSLKTEWLLIPFFSGGFDADTGLTGRKNILWYGPSIPTGGGSFAGKDATKVDRTGAYLARMIASHGINNGKKECLVEIAYAIGQKYPLYLKIDGLIFPDVIRIGTLEEIIQRLGLRKPVFQKASLNGHFGYGVNWEMVN